MRATVENSLEPSTQNVTFVARLSDNTSRAGGGQTGPSVLRVAVLALCAAGVVLAMYAFRFLTARLRPTKNLVYADVPVLLTNTGFTRPNHAGFTGSGTGNILSAADYRPCPPPTGRVLNLRNNVRIESRVPANPLRQAYTVVVAPGPSAAARGAEPLGGDGPDAFVDSSLAGVWFLATDPRLPGEARLIHFMARNAVDLNAANRQIKFGAGAAIRRLRDLGVTIPGRAGGTLYAIPNVAPRNTQPPIPPPDW
jgi:hypothetical protein